MKSFLLSLLLFLLITQANFPQWTNQNPVPDGNNLWSTFFIDDNTGWMVGSEGFIKKTTNAGLDWIEQNSGTTLILKSIQFVDQNTGWICGESGLILKSTDGGVNWDSLASGTTQHLTDIHFYDADTGFVVGFGGTILKTTDGGSSWTCLSSGTTNDLNSVDFVDAYVGYAVGGENPTLSVLKTTDGGISWINKSTGVPSFLGYLLCVKFIDANIGFVGGGQLYMQIIFKTTNGGDTWIQSMKSPSRPKEITQREQVSTYHPGGINSIFFKDSNIGFAVAGSEAAVYRGIFITTDGGSTWNDKFSIHPDEGGLFSVYGNSRGQAWAVGRDGVIYITEDDGNSWVQILSGRGINCDGDELYTVFCMNENIGWAGGYRRNCTVGQGDIILKTTNGGKIWKTQLNYPYNKRKISSVYFINENMGWGTSNGSGEYFLRTIDGGENWIYEGGGESSVFFINQNTGWTTKDDEYNSGIYKSTDGGFTWTQKSSISSSSVYFSDINTGWVTGPGGTLKSTDGGESWIQKSANCGSCVRFYNSNIGVTVGSGGEVSLSTDGGETWSSLSSGTSNDLTSVAFTNSTTFWVAGYNGTILNTTDLGNNWTSYDGVTENDLTSLSFVNEYTGWVCGMSGTMFKYHNGVVPVELISFTANVKNNRVQLNWQTATEINNYGFEIERTSPLPSPYQEEGSITERGWEKIAFVSGYGTTNEPKSYSFTDRIAMGGNKLKYRLKQVDFDGKYKYSNEVEIEIVPEEFILYQNYPNPFNPSTVIEFSLPEDISNVRLSIDNALGEKVAELVNGSLAAGRYQYRWNAKNLATGIYIYELRTEKFVAVKKMVLMK